MDSPQIRKAAEECVHAMDSGVPWSLDLLRGSMVNAGIARSKAEARETRFQEHRGAIIKIANPKSRVPG